MTTAKLRENIYRVLDRVSEVVREGRALRIIASRPSSRLARLEKRDCIRGNPDDLVGIDWSKKSTR